MPSNKYLSKWSGENIDHAYEVVQHLNSNQADKIAYIDSEGNLKATSFKKESIGIVNTLDWNSEPAYNFAIKDVNGKISLSSYNSYSFISYNDSLSSGNNPSGNLAYFTTFTVGNVTKYYVEDTGISVVQVTTALGKVAELETQLAAALEQVAELEAQLTATSQEINSLKQRVSAIEGDYVVAGTGEHTEVEVSGNSIKFISNVTTSGDEISFTQSSTHLDGNDILL